MSNESNLADEPPGVLVVSPVETVLWALTERLASAGYAVTGCPSVWRACKLASSGRFALVILDVSANNAPTRELVRFLHAGEVRVKLLALMSAKMVMSHPLLEVDHITLKPVRPEELLEGVARLFSGNTSKSGGRGPKPS